MQSRKFANITVRSEERAIERIRQVPAKRNVAVSGADPSKSSDTVEVDAYEHVKFHDLLYNLLTR
jgi:hypothetical protein